MSTRSLEAVVLVFEEKRLNVINRSTQMPTLRHRQSSASTSLSATVTLLSTFEAFYLLNANIGTHHSWPTLVEGG